MTDKVFFSGFKTTVKSMESVNSDERYFEGLLTVQMKDKQGEITIVDELYKVLPVWIDRGAPISDTHSNRIVGKGISYSRTMVKSDEGEELPAIKIVGKIFKNYELDNLIWDKIKSGEYKGLSFGGATRANRSPISMKDGSTAYALKDLEHYEVAVCKDPAVPMAIITDYNPIAKSLFTSHIRDEDKMVIQCSNMGCYVEKDALIKIEDEDDKNTEAEVLDEWKNDDNDSGEEDEEKKKADHADADGDMKNQASQDSPQNYNTHTINDKQAEGLKPDKTIPRIKREFEDEGHGDPFDTAKSSPQGIQKPEKYGEEAGVQQTSPAQSHVGNKKQQTERFNTQENDFKRTNMARAGMLDTDPKQAVKADNPCWEGYEQYGMKDKDGKQVPNCVKKADEDKPLNKPMRDDGDKKFKVYVRDPSTGNVVTVRFGDPNMEIKRDDPERRESFRARHDCDNAKDITTPQYWSCKMWEKETSVSEYTEKNIEDVAKADLGKIGTFQGKVDALMREGYPEENAKKIVGAFVKGEKKKDGAGISAGGNSGGLESSSSGMMNPVHNSRPQEIKRKDTKKIRKMNNLLKLTEIKRASSTQMFGVGGIRHNHGDRTTYQQGGDMGGFSKVTVRNANEKQKKGKKTPKR